jgi:uncharacterized protein YegL
MKMKNNLVELIFIMDRSGSMRGLEEDTVGGFNSMIEKQRELEGKVIVSTVLFNQRSSVIHNRLDIKAIEDFKVSDYEVSGTTALLDAVGRSIRHIRRIYCDTLRENRPNKVVFMITTDGMENASKEFTYQRLKRYIDRAQEEYDWEFIFIGAHMDAIKEASRIGIRSERAVRYKADERGTRANFRAMNRAMSDVRANRAISEDWKKEVEEDFDNRK